MLTMNKSLVSGTDQWKKWKICDLFIIDDFFYIEKHRSYSNCMFVRCFFIFELASRHFFLLFTQVHTSFTCYHWSSCFSLVRDPWLFSISTNAALFTTPLTNFSLGIPLLLFSFEFSSHRQILSILSSVDMSNNFYLTFSFRILTIFHGSEISLRIADVC